MIRDNMKLSNRCDVHPEDPSVPTSKAMVDLELQFSCAKHDVDTVSIIILLSNGDIFNGCFHDHNLDYLPRMNPGLILHI